MTADTIYALSSGAPPAAIAVIRISGVRATDALRSLAGRSLEPRRASLVQLTRPGTEEVLDNALALFFLGPNSATGEDIVELHLHGGRSVVRAVLGVLAEQAGLREARPGEFTRRAFENGRIDLAEAEGLADLLQAETESQRRAALALAGGALSRQVDAWQQALLAIAAQYEAVLDFSDEGDVGEGDVSAPPELDHLVAEIERSLGRPDAERLRDGLRVIIAGPPNTGKSSLLNYLTGREAAITSAVAGTTRDLVEAPTALEGIPFLLIDTAGLRDSTDPIEAAGVARAQAALASADLILWLGNPEDCPSHERAIIVRSMADLSPGSADPRVAVSVSAKTGEGIADLLALIGARARHLLPVEGEVALNTRHRAALRECLNALCEAGGSSDFIIASEALRQARSTLDAITGRVGVEQMLDALFGRFCIGK